MKTLNEKEIEEILSIPLEDLKASSIRELFAETKDRKKRFKFTDKFFLPKGKINNKEGVLTTLGRYFFNGFVFYNIKDKVDFVNRPLNKGGLEFVLSTVASMLLEDKITVEEYMDFYRRIEWLGFSTTCFTSPSVNMEELECPPKTKKLKEELFAKYAKEIKQGDIQIITMVEKELIASAKIELEGTDIKDLLDSGAKGSFEANYKNMVLMRGLIPRTGAEAGKYYCSTGNLMEGTPPEDQYMYCNIQLQGSSGRAIDTQKSGYMSKQIMAAFQGIELDEPDSDCGTKLTLEVEITEKNYKKFLYNYIEEKGKIVCLSPDIIKKYIGKTVKKRSPMYCKTPKICEHCFGKLPYIIGIQKIGLTVSQLAESLKNLSMKRFHTSAVKLGKINLERYLTKV